MVSRRPGTPARDDVPGLVLIPAAGKVLTIPILASGGIADGRGTAAALALGAEGVNMGTRFTLTREAPVHEAVKLALMNGSERDTNLIFKPFKNTARVFRNAVSAKVHMLEARPGAVFEDVRALVGGARRAGKTVRQMRARYGPVRRLIYERYSNLRRAYLSNCC